MKWSIAAGHIFEWDWLKREKDIRWNWITITPIMLEFEYGSYKARYVEMRFIFMGFGFWVEIYNTAERIAFGEECDLLINELILKEEDKP